MGDHDKDEEFIDVHANAGESPYQKWVWRIAILSLIIAIVYKALTS